MSEKKVKESKKKVRMNTKTIVLIAAAVALLVFFILSAKVIDSGTEGQYTGVVAFDAGASSSGDWEHIVAEITEKAEDAATLDVATVGNGKAVRLTGTVSEFVSKGKGKKNSMTIVPDGYSGNTVFTVQLGSVYNGTAIRDVQTLKEFGSVTNQTEWSQYGRALNDLVHEHVVAPLAIDETVQGKKVTIVGAAVMEKNQMIITPVAITIE